MLLHLTRAEADRLIGLLHKDTAHQLDTPAGAPARLGAGG